MFQIPLTRDEAALLHGLLMQEGEAEHDSDEPDEDRIEMVETLATTLDMELRGINQSPRANPELLAAAQRALPWIGKLIANGGHLETVCPNDAIGAMQQLEAAIVQAGGKL